MFALTFWHILIHILDSFFIKATYIHKWKYYISSLGSEKANFSKKKSSIKPTELAKTVFCGIPLSHDIILIWLNCMFMIEERWYNATKQDSNSNV